MVHPRAAWAASDDQYTLPWPDRASSLLCSITEVDRFRTTDARDCALTAERW
jgi:hypothetical protein